MEAVKNLFFSFPVQLFIRHLEKNQLLLVPWILIILVATNNFGRVYGIPYLFLDPEYLDKVSFVSFFIVGLTFGGLVIAFHITCYILYCRRFAFIGILKKPFSKFSVNNSLLPLAVLIVYIISIIIFQVDNEFSTLGDIMAMISGLLAGILTIIVIIYLYFKLTNKDIFRYLTSEVDRTLKKTSLNRQRALDNLKESKNYDHSVRSYLDLTLRPQTTENLFYFYDKDAVLKVFDQNHFNSVVIETVLIGLILLLRFFMDIPYFQIPAAASTLLLMTFLVMITGAITYWFREWSIAVALSLFFIVNGFMKAGILNAVYEAPGLDYNAQKADYSIEKLAAFNSDEQIEADKNHTLNILENWKSKWPDSVKRKMIFICASGGGQRAALWSVNALYEANLALDGKLMDHTMLMTGASGGAIGAAYFRELESSENDFEIESTLTNISKDNLNPIIFSLVVNDLVLRNQFYEYAGKKYLKDRGYAFEQQMNKNTDNLLNKTLLSYREREFESEIPMLILGPTISLDGRKLYISPHPVSYFNNAPNDFDKQVEFKNSSIDFIRFFDQQGSENLKLLTALRMNASFPYVTPNVRLPSEPSIEIMDAGVADNFGVSDALKFLYNFKEWIAENTSGVIILSIRDTRKNAPIEEKSHLSILERISVPISSVYNNLGNYQDINNDYKLTFAKEWFPGDLDVVSIEYNTYSIFQERKFKNKARESWIKELERAALSWHLTKKEKRNIIANIDLPNNKAALDRLKMLVQTDSLN